MSRALSAAVLGASLLLLAAGTVAAQGVERPKGTTIIDLNRPLSPFECNQPIALNWYGSTARCLQELCAGRNVFNEYVFDEAHRRRRNPCWGQSPTEVDWP
jgi:hypothetical protein